MMNFFFRIVFINVLLTFFGSSAQGQDEQCLLSDVLLVDPAPIDGFYEPGQTVEFCYTITNWSSTAANWFHSVTPTLGPGWDASSLTPTSMPGGDWIFVNSITATSGSGTTLGPSFGYDSNNDGNPGNNWGQFGSGPWSFCWEVTVGDCPPNVTGTSLDMVVNTGGDYETGSWGSSACLSDPVEVAYADISCCPVPILDIQQPSCHNDCDGEVEAFGNGDSPFDYEWFDAAASIIGTSYGAIGTHTLQDLCAGNYSVTITDGSGCITTVQFEILDPQEIQSTVENISSCTPITVNGTIFSSSQTVVNTYSSASGCDSLVTSNLTITPATGVLNTVSICEGDSYSEGTSVYTSTGTYTDNYLNSAGCDSIVTTSLTVNPAYASTNTVIICEGESFTEGTSVYTTTGVFTDVYSTSSGCDSVITTALTVSSSNEVSNAVSICEGDSYIEGTSEYITSGTYINSYSTSAGCDSVITTVLSVNPLYTTTNTATICEGESYTEGNSTYTTTGIYSDSYISMSGCDSIVTTSLTVDLSYGLTNEVSICDGGEYTEGSSTYTAGGTYVDAYLSTAGCDSIITTVLTVTSQFEVTNEVGICQGESYAEGSSIYSMTGVYQDIYTSSLGCDSIVTTDLTVSPIYGVTNTVTICEGESYTEGNSTYTTTGIYSDSYISTSGCDSIITTSLTVDPSYGLTNEVSICDGGAYTEGSSTYTTGGTYVDAYQTTAGCDSIITTVLTVTSQFEVTNEVGICQGESYAEGSSIYSMTGVYQDIYISSLGCDSIVTTNLAVGEPSSVTNDVTICEGESFTQGSSVYISSGNYTDVYLNSVGCDSTITTELTVLPSPSITNSISICSGEDYSEGTSVYSESGTYVDLYANANGCDSIVTTILNVIEQFDTYNAVTICNGASYSEGSELYEETGIYTYLYTSASGCDSIVTTDLTIVDPFETTNTVSICNGEIYSEGTSIYDEAGTYTDVYLSSIGCDSTIITVLSLLPVPNVTNEATICFGESYSEGTSVYTVSGQYQDVYSASNGCDSVVTSDLLVLDQIETITTAEICEGEEYIEGTSVYTVSGLYSDLYTSENGCDSIVTTQLTVAYCCEPNMTFVEMRFCESLPTDTDFVFILEGIFDTTYVAFDGCDSIVTTEVILNPSYFIIEDIDICEGGSYMIGNDIYSTSGTHIIDYETNLGCDSVITTNLEVHLPSAVDNEVDLCEDELLIIGNSIYAEAGVYVDSLQSEVGCDSVVTSYVTVIESTTVSLDTTICEGETYFSGGSTFDQTGIYSNVFSSAAGCDSTVVLNLTVGEVYQENKVIRLCEGETHSEGSSRYTETGIYYDIYASTHGCDSLVVTDLEVVGCHCSVFAPNAVTADGDEVNDSFKIEFDCEFSEYELIIFNRWGLKIFSSTDPEKVWIPSSENSEYYAPDGIYSYRLQYSYIDRSTDLPVGPIRETGTITVLR